MTNEAQATNSTGASTEVADTFDYGRANEEVDTDTSTSDQTADDQNTDVHAGESQETDTPADDSEEIEHEGQKLKIPKAAKPLLMMQADYTRKTQEVADQRKAVEAQKSELENQAKAQQEYIQDLAQVVACDNALKQYEQVNWQQLNAQDPVQAQALWFQYQQLKETRDSAAGQIYQKDLTRKQQDEQRKLEAQQTSAKKIQDCLTTVAREIKGWTPELGRQLEKTAGELGYSNDDIKAALEGDHGVKFVKLLHEAHLGRQLLKKQTPPTPKPQTPPKPVPQVGGSAPARKDPERMNMDEWVKNRRAELRGR